MIPANERNLNKSHKISDTMIAKSDVKSSEFKTNTKKTPIAIWTMISEHLKLDHYSHNHRVQKEVKNLLADKKSLETILHRSDPYIYYIYSQTQLRHLPAELVLIPIIESQYNPNDHNSINAMGLWQLMPSTARDLGLKIHDGDRRNVVTSTNAALTFFNYLKNKFNGHWDLAFAAYNCGPGCVDNAIKNSKSKNYFKLKLPLETRIYVPKLLALAVIIKHAKEYDIILPKIQDKP